jgi:hypothetical protein
MLRNDWITSSYFQLLLPFTSCGGDLGSFCRDNFVR